MSKIYKRFAFDISMLEILYQGAAGKQKIEAISIYRSRARLKA